MLEAIREAWRLRRAWWFTATARTRARFARTMLGSFWLGLSNVLSIGVLGVVYGTVFRVQDFNHYIVYLGTGLVCWGLIASSISSAPFILEGNARQILNTNFHPIFYTLEEWSFQIQTFAQAFTIVILVLMLFKPLIVLNVFAAALVPLFNLGLFCYWFPLLICLMGARFKDFYQLIPILLQLVFLLSPILYQRHTLAGLQWIADINPLYLVMNQVRHALISGMIDWRGDIVLFALNVVGVTVSVAVLQNQRYKLPFLF